MSSRNSRNSIAHDSSPRGYSHAVVSGGPRLDPTAPPSGTVLVIDLRSRAVVATVTGVGNDPYGLTILEEGKD